MVTMVLDKIKCEESLAHGLLRNDEVYIEYKVDDQGFRSRFPTKGHVKMKDGDEWACDLEISFDKKVLIELFDHEEVLSKFIVSHTYTDDDIPANILLKNPDDAEYRLYATKKS